MIIKEAIIPAAGSGIRMLPFTKAVPKELVPVGNLPLIAHVIEEALQIGVERFILVTRKRKEMLENFFRPVEDLYAQLEASGSMRALEVLRRYDLGDRLKVVYQPEPKGLGHAVALAGEHVQGKQCFVMLPDEFFPDSPSSLEQLMKGVSKEADAVLAVKDVPAADVSRYGIIGEIEKISQRVMLTRALVEKPAVEDAPSRLAIVGRYAVSRKVLEILKKTPPGRGGEIQLTDAIASIAGQGKVIAVHHSGRRFDCGSTGGVFQAWSALAEQNRLMV